MPGPYHTIKYFRDWFNDINEIICDIHIALENIKYLYSPDSKLEEVIIRRYGFLDYHTFQLKFILVIQLAKLFSDSRSQKRNFHKLCEKIEKSFFNESDIEKQFEINRKENGMYKLFNKREDVLECVCEIQKELYEKKEIIDKIETVRNKIYAHKDPESVSDQINTEDLETMAKLSAKIYNDLQGRLFNECMTFSSVSDWKVKYIVKNLAENAPLPVLRKYRNISSGEKG